MHKPRGFSTIIVLIAIVAITALGYFSYQYLGSNGNKTYQGDGFSVAYQSSYKQSNQQSNVSGDLTHLVSFMGPLTPNEPVDSIDIERGENKMMPQGMDLYHFKLIEQGSVQTPITIGGEAGTRISRNGQEFIFFVHTGQVYMIWIQGPHTEDNLTLILNSFKLSA